MTNLDSSDPWIAANSPLPADKLHAIGVIAFRWNRCELGLFLLLSAVAKLPRRDVWAMTHDLGDMAMCDRVRTFALFRGYHPDGMTLISNALTIYDRCRQNRNSIIHAWTISVGRDPPLARKSKKGSDPEPIPLPSAISELRRVAEEIGDLETRLWLLDRLLQDRMMDGPHTLPEILPLPEILLKPPRPVRKDVNAGRDHLIGNLYLVLIGIFPKIPPRAWTLTREPIAVLKREPIV